MSNKGTVGKQIHFWQYCPVEILITVFEILDAKSLHNCFHVNKKWQDIVDRVATRKNLWQELLKEGLENSDSAYTQKSTLGWRDLYYNMYMWNYVKQAKAAHKYIYYLKLKHPFHALNVYKEKVIVVYPQVVLYIDIPTAFKRRVHLECSDFIENDHMVMIYNKNRTGSIRVHGKTSPDASNTIYYKKHAVEFSGPIVLYKTDGRYCYAADYKNILWRSEWVKNKWKTTSVRYYGSESMVALNVHCGQVFVLLKWGSVFRVRFDTKEMVKVCRMEINADLNMPPLMFNGYNVVLAASPEEEFSSQLYKDPIYGDYQIYTARVCQSPNMSCATQHGNVLLFGYRDGRIDICLTSKYMQGNTLPECSFNLKSIDWNLRDPTVLALDVHEAKNKHMIFIGTRSKVYSIKLSYSDIFNNGNRSLDTSSKSKSKTESEGFSVLAMKVKHLIL